MDWANAVPDATASVNFTINSTQLVFTGPDHYDKDWGDQPFFESADNSYQGHRPTRLSISTPLAVTGEE